MIDSILSNKNPKLTDFIKLKLNPLKTLEVFKQWLSINTPIESHGDPLPALRGTHNIRIDVVNSIAEELDITIVQSFMFLYIPTFLRKYLLLDLYKEIDYEFEYNEILSIVKDCIIKEIELFWSFNEDNVSQYRIAKGFNEVLLLCDKCNRSIPIIYYNQHYQLCGSNNDRYKRIDCEYCGMNFSRSYYLSNHKETCKASHFK